MWMKEGKSGGVSQALNEEIGASDTRRIRVPLGDLRKYCEAYVSKCGFSSEETRLTCNNLIEAELAGKASHGIIRLGDLKSLSERGDIRIGTDSLTCISESSDAMFFDAEYQSGAVAVYRSLDAAMSRLAQNSDSHIMMVGIRNMSYASGYIGDFARVAADNGFVYLSFFNSPPVLIPHGSSEAQWGTDPLTFSFPEAGTAGEGDRHVIHDMASSLITWGEMMNANREGRSLPRGVAMDAAGNATTDPREGMKGGLLPVGSYKGSGIAMMIELLAGAMTGSRVGSAIDGGWGGLYILMKPETFLGDRTEVHSRGQALTSTLLGSRKETGVEAIRHPGQASQQARHKRLEEDGIEVPELLWNRVLEFCQA